jgi:hypothetical protein
MTARAIDNPRPAPSGVFEKNGSKARCKSSGRKAYAVVFDAQNRHAL